MEYIVLLQLIVNCKWETIVNKNALHVCNQAADFGEFQTKGTYFISWMHLNHLRNNWLVVKMNTADIVTWKLPAHVLCTNRESSEVQPICKTIGAFIKSIVYTYSLRWLAFLLDVYPYLPCLVTKRQFRFIRPKWTVRLSVLDWIGIITKLLIDYF